MMIDDEDDIDNDDDDDYDGGDGRKTASKGFMQQNTGHGPPTPPKQRFKRQTEE